MSETIIDFTGKKALKKSYLTRRAPSAFTIFSFFGVSKIYTVVKSIRLVP